MGNTDEKDSNQVCRSQNDNKTDPWGLHVTLNRSEMSTNSSLIIIQKVTSAEPVWREGTSGFESASH